MKTLLFATFAANLILAEIDYVAIGEKVWQNEGGGRKENLVVWNHGEDFPSLGIGHFIWYPKDEQGPYTEMFPELLVFLTTKKIEIPEVLSQFPWKDRQHFRQTRNSKEVKQIEQFLYETIPYQVEFIARRLEHSLNKMLRVIPPEKWELVRSNFESLYKTTKGQYALMDYINFKGEGINPNERYNGQGWGLLQVLEEMGAEGEFADAAASVLKRRVENNPKDKQWEKGWLNRVATYR